MHPRSFTAWCRHDGAHKTKKYPHRDWNDELVEPVRKIVGRIFPAFVDELQRCKDDLLERLVLLLDGIRNDLKGTHNPPMLCLLAILIKNPFFRRPRCLTTSYDSFLDVAFVKEGRLAEAARHRLHSDRENQHVSQLLFLPNHDAELEVQQCARACDKCRRRQPPDGSDVSDIRKTSQCHW